MCSCISGCIHTTTKIKEDCAQASSKVDYQFVEILYPHQKLESFYAMLAYEIHNCYQFIHIEKLMDEKTLTRTSPFLQAGILSKGIFMPFICQKLFLFRKFEVNIQVLTPLKQQTFKFITIKTVKISAPHKQFSVRTILITSHL